MVPQYKKVKTAGNVFTIVETIEALGQTTCSKLADEVDLSVSSVYNYLRTLEDEGYVVETDGEYRLSLRFLQKGRAVRNSFPIMHAAVEPLDVLAKAIDEYLSVFVQERGRAVMIHEVNSHHSVQVPAPFLGEPFQLTKTPQGRTILAHMPDSFQRGVISEAGLDEQAAEREYRKLERIRDEKIDVDEGQAHENIWAVAAPVVVEDELYGSIMISTVRHRLDEQRARHELPALLRQTVREVEHRLSRYDFDNLYSPW